MRVPSHHHYQYRRLREAHGNRAERFIEKATSLANWETWISRDQLAHLEGRVKTLKSFGINLKARKAVSHCTKHCSGGNLRRASTFSGSADISSRISCKTTANQTTQVYCIHEKFLQMEERLGKPARPEGDIWLSRSIGLLLQCG